MTSGEALATINSLFKERLGKKDIWERSDILNEWTEVLIELMLREMKNAKRRARHPKKS